MVRAKSGLYVTLIGLAMLIAINQASMGAPIPLSDRELDGVYAEGLVFDLDMKLDIQEGSTVSFEGGNVEDLKALLENGLSWKSAGVGDSGGTVKAMLEPGGDLNLDGLLGSIYVGGNALQNTQNLFNLIVQGGDVAVGINISVILNPVDSNFSLYNFNFNFGDGTVTIGQ